MSKYLYNDVELPTLPEWDKTTYPYAVIVSIKPSFGTTSYSLRCSAEPSVYNYPSTSPIGVTPSPSISYTKIDSGEWGNLIEYTDNNTWLNSTTLKERALWANHDLKNADGEVTFTASYPIDAETGEEIHDYEIGNTVTTTPIPADFYIKKGGKVYKVGGGGSNFIFANSKEELPDPYTVPENTVGLVPSEGAGGGGLPVVELETEPTPNGAALTAAESALMDEVLSKGTLPILRFRFNGGQVEGLSGKVIMEGVPVFTFYIQQTDFMLLNMGDGWVFSASGLEE